MAKINLERHRAFLKVLLNKYSEGRDLTRFLTQEDASGIEKVALSTVDLDFGLNQASDFLNQVHYSWFLDVFKKIPEGERTLILSALSKEKIKSFKGVVEADFDLIEGLPVYLKPFFYKVAYRYFKNNSIFPYQWGKKSPLSPLLELKKSELLRVIDFLGVHDLAAEIPKVLGRDILQRIYVLLSVKQKRYLQCCMVKKELFILPELGLNKWNGDIQLMRNLLHRRGLIRFAVAISGEDVFFKWFLYHILDIGRASFIKKNQADKVSKDVNNYLQESVLNIVNLLMER